MPKLLRFAVPSKHLVDAMPPRRQIADRPDRKQDLKSWLKREYKDPVKYQANVVRFVKAGVVLLRRLRSADLGCFFMQQLLKAVALFAGSIVVMRNFGDAFAI